MIVSRLLKYNQQVGELLGTYSVRTAIPSIVTREQGPDFGQYNHEVGRFHDQNEAIVKARDIHSTSQKPVAVFDENGSLVFKLPN